MGGMTVEHCIVEIRELLEDLRDAQAEQGGASEAPAETHQRVYAATIADLRTMVACWERGNPLYAKTQKLLEEG